MLKLMLQLMQRVLEEGPMSYLQAEPHERADEWTATGTGISLGYS